MTDDSQLAGNTTGLTAGCKQSDDLTHRPHRPQPQSIPGYAGMLLLRLILWIWDRLHPKNAVYHGHGH